MENEYSPQSMYGEIREEITKTADVLPYLNNICGKKQEHFLLLVLNKRNQVLKKKVLFRGGIDFSVIDIRVIFHEFFKVKGATAIIVAHNHPSGYVRPSDEDKKITNRLDQCCKLFGIRFLDHIVVNRKEYISIRNEFPGLFE